MVLVGARDDIQPFGVDLLPGKSNYFIGNEPGRWRTNIPNYRQVYYPDVYPGIDLVFYGNRRELEYDFRVKPGADPERIQLAFQGVDQLRVNDAGDLILTVGGAEVEHRRPRIYQEWAGQLVDIGGAYLVSEGRSVRFAVKPYDKARALVIDPVLVFSTYLGGSNGDFGSGIAVDEAGNVYVLGDTNSHNFPTTDHAFQREQPDLIGGTSALVAKIDASGSYLVYSTYLGGTGSGIGYGEHSYRIAVDHDGNAHVVGTTPSQDFPVRAAFQASYGGGPGDGFITKLNADGSDIIYSTYLGGRYSDDAMGIAVDKQGCAYVSGTTESSDFPTLRAIQPRYGGYGCLVGNPCGDAFVAKFSPNGSAIYSTYLGGPAADAALDIATDEYGNAYVVGATSSNNFPITPDAFQPQIAGGYCGPPYRCQDAFISVLSSDGSTLVYSTYLGGNLGDGAFGVALGVGGNVYVAGGTRSPDFPTRNPLQPSLGGQEDIFVTKLNVVRSELVYSTYLGGVREQRAFAIGVDRAGSAYVTGYTLSPDFWTVDSLFPFRGGQGCTNIFVSKFRPSGDSLEYSTYLGPSGPPSTDAERRCRSQEWAGYQLAVDAFGNAYVTGYTSSPDFPTVDPLQPQFAGAWDAVIAKIAATSPRDTLASPHTVRE